MTVHPTFKGISYPQHNFESAYATILEMKELLEVLSGMKSPGRRAAFFDELESKINIVYAKGYITDAPEDGNEYARKDGAWVVVSGGIEEAPLDGTQYGRQSGIWTPVVGGGGGGGDVFGPASVTADNPTVFNGTTGKVIKELTYAVFKTNLALTKSDVGLSNVDNTSDVNKPVSTAQAAAIALKANIASPTFTGDPKAPTPTAGDNDTSIATTAFVTSAVSTATVPPATVAPLMDGVAAVGTTTKYAREDHRHPTDTSREATIAAGTTAQYWRGDKSWQTLDKAAVGLANVDNTSDANKPVSTAQAAAIALKADLASPIFTGDPKVPTAAPGDNDTSAASTAFVTAAINAAAAVAATVAPLMDGVAAVGVSVKYAREDHKHPTDTSREPTLAAGTTAQYYRGDKSWQTLDKAAVGLANVDNTSDASKPVSTATQTALDLKAPLASPILTGNPTAPTPTAGDNDTSIATTAFVTSAVTTAAVPPATVAPLMDGVAAVGVVTKYAREDHKHPTDTSREPTLAAGTTAQYYRGDKSWQTLDKTAVGLANVDNTSDVNKPVSTAQQTALNLKANLAGPTFTGDPKAPTPSPGDNDTSIATTAFVTAAVGAIIASADAMVYKGVIDCSANPNYPAADAGHTYKVSVAGKIGGASGPNVEVGDQLLCTIDGTASGTHAVVGAQWNIVQANIDGAVVGPATSVDSNPAVYNGATGKVIKEITYPTFKTNLALVKGDVGLGNVDNTSDVNKPISTATQTALDLKAPLASPALTGNPTAPTPLTADNDTSIATTAHVQANMALKANVSHTHAQADITNLVTDLAAKAPLASPVFTGNPTAPTPATADNDTSIATTAHVQANMALKANVSHTHVIADTTGLQAALDGKAALIHTHVIADTTGLQAALDAKQALDATLTALAAFATNGIVTRTGVDTFAGRTLTATAGGGIAITDGDGVAGNPTFAIDPADTITWTAQQWISYSNASLIINATTGASVLAIRAPVGFNRQLIYYTGGVARWNLYADSAAEGGSNAGSNFGIYAYDDAGAALGTALSIARATRAITATVSLTSPSIAASAAMTAPTRTAGDSTTNVATTAFVTSAVTTAAVPPATVDPLMDGVATVGTTTKYAREDHRHPTDTSRAAVSHTHAQADVTNLVTDLAAKAPLASPVFTGNPTAPTPATADNDTSIATTAHVQANMALKANVSHTHAQADVTNLVTDLAAKAPLASPALTGTPTVPTAAPGTNTTQAASTAFVGAAVTAAAVPAPATVNPLMDGAVAVGITTKYAREDHRHPVDTSREAAIAAGTTAQYWRGDKSWQTLDKAAVGLANVDNTSDAAKPVSTAQQTALNLKANLASPALTGVPTAPTAANGTNTTQIATTAFVEAEAVVTANALALKAPLASPIFTGNPTAPTPTAGDNDTSIATTEFVTDAIAAAGTAPIAPGYRNLIINGDFSIDQRNAGVQVVVPSGGVAYGPDRWWGSCAPAGGTIGLQRVADASYLGEYYMSVAVGTADASLVAGDYYHIGQMIEGHMMRGLNWGGAQAKQVTVSFTAWASASFTLTLSLRNSGNARSYVTTFAVTTTRTRFTFTIPGDITGTWLYDTGRGVEVSIGLASGTTYNAASLNTWLAGAFFSHSSASNFMAGANTLYLKDFQFERGAVVTDFERLLQPEGVSRCQRYYQEVGPTGTWPRMQGYNAAGQYLIFPIGLPTTMRVAPTVTKLGTWHVANSAQPGSAGINPSGFSIALQATAAGTTESYPNTADDYFTLNAEI